MNLGSQYYRAPFPENRYWEDDLRRMREAGLNTVQLWLLWAWIEAKPHAYVFDDYDRLIELADKHGLGVLDSLYGGPRAPLRLGHHATRCDRQRAIRVRAPVNRSRVIPDKRTST